MWRIPIIVDGDMECTTEYLSPTPVAQIPQYTSRISHNAPHRNRNVHTCAHLWYNMVHCGIFVLCIVGFVRLPLGMDGLYEDKLSILHWSACWIPYNTHRTETQQHVFVKRTRPFNNTCFIMFANTCIWWPHFFITIFVTYVLSINESESWNTRSKYRTFV